MRNPLKSADSKVNQTTGASDNVAPRVPTDEKSVQAAKKMADPATPNAADNHPAEYTPANPQINSPTVTGFTAGDTGVTSPQETGGLRKLTLDEATNLRTALDDVIGYQTGVVYHHNFSSGLEALRTYGLTFDTDKAVAEATKLQNEVASQDLSQASSDD